MSGFPGKGLYNLDFADLACLVNVSFDSSLVTGLSCFRLAFFLIEEVESLGPVRRLAEVPGTDVSGCSVTSIGVLGSWTEGTTASPRFLQKQFG